MHRIPGGRTAALSLILAAALAGAPALAADVEVGGLRVPDQLSEGGRALVLNGAGVRKVRREGLRGRAARPPGPATPPRWSIARNPPHAAAHAARRRQQEPGRGAAGRIARQYAKQELEALKEPPNASALMASVGSARKAT